MTAELLLASLQLSTPEIILAIGALALLMIGVFSGERSTTTVTGPRCRTPDHRRPVAGDARSGTAWPMAAPSFPIRSPAS